MSSVLLGHVGGLFEQPLALALSLSNLTSALSPGNSSIPPLPLASNPLLSSASALSFRISKVRRALSNWEGSARLKSERIASTVDVSIVDEYSL